MSRYKNPLHKGIYRNNICPCGSGKKAKKCHGINSVVTKDELQFIIDKSIEFNNNFKKALQEQITINNKESRSNK